jgi:hypothetical protein
MMRQSSIFLTNSRGCQSQHWRCEADVSPASFIICSGGKTATRMSFQNEPYKKSGKIVKAGRSCGKWRNQNPLDYSMISGHVWK